MDLGYDRNHPRRSGRRSLLLSASRDTPTLPQGRLNIGLRGGHSDQREPVPPHALAGRLSDALWGSMLDDGLRQLADSGEIGNHKILIEQLQRLLADPR